MIITDREVGKLLLSIGTSLAFEGIMGIHDVAIVQKPAPLYRADELWINIRTLLRNIYGAISKDTRKTLQYADYQETLFDEMRQIVDLAHRETNGKIWIKFYYPTHRSILTRYPHATLKSDNSANGIALREIERWVIDGSYNQPPYHVEQINLDINCANPYMLILTHQPVDLLHIHGTLTVGLVESHTGVVKEAHRWYTKLKGCAKEPRIPFNAVTMQLFGDSGDEFQAAPLRYRTELITLADKQKWTQNTSVPMMMRSIQQHGSKELKDLVKGF